MGAGWLLAAVGRTAVVRGAALVVRGARYAGADVGGALERTTVTRGRGVADGEGWLLDRGAIATLAADCGVTGRHVGAATVDWLGIE